LRARICLAPVARASGQIPHGGDLAVFFGEEGDDVNALKADYRLIHVSPDIGFWPNRLHAYVFAVP
jgi:hypothetical protein